LLSTVFKEAIMDTRIPLLFAVALGAAAFSAIPAIAADEGPVAAKIASTGTPLKIIPVGNYGGRVFVSEEQGTIERGGDTHQWPLRLDDARRSVLCL
jgi:hypothetical protein